MRERRKKAMEIRERLHGDGIVGAKQTPRYDIILIIYCGVIMFVLLGGW